jgi:hypothetical protein
MVPHPHRRSRWAEVEMCSFHSWAQGLKFLWSESMMPVRDIEQQQASEVFFPRGNQLILVPNNEPHLLGFIFFFCVNNQDQERNSKLVYSGAGTRSRRRLGQLIEPVAGSWHKAWIVDGLGMSSRSPKGDHVWQIIQHGWPTWALTSWEKAPCGSCYCEDITKLWLPWIKVFRRPRCTFGPRELRRQYPVYFQQRGNKGAYVSLASNVSWCFMCFVV